MKRNQETYVQTGEPFQLKVIEIAKYLSKMYRNAPRQILIYGEYSIDDSRRPLNDNIKLLILFLFNMFSFLQCIQLMFQTRLLTQNTISSYLKYVQHQNKFDPTQH